MEQNIAHYEINGSVSVQPQKESLLEDAFPLNTHSATATGSSINMLNWDSLLKPVEDCCSSGELYLRLLMTLYFDSVEPERDRWQLCAWLDHFFCLRARVRVSVLPIRSIRLSGPISKVVECVELHLRSNNHAQDKLKASSR